MVSKTRRVGFLGPWRGSLHRDTGTVGAVRCNRDSGAAEGKGDSPQSRLLNQILLTAIKGSRMTRIPGFALISSLCVMLISSLVAAEPPLPEIPGITVADAFPGGCVDCHVERPEERMDVRISTQMKQWHERVDAKVLERVRPIAANTAELSGQHPQLPAQSYDDIPASCRECHADFPKGVLPLGAMVHALHLTGGRENHFLTIFGGQCTHCHKYNADIGMWFIPSGPER